MPLTEKGKTMLKNFKDQYGDKEGESFFYAYLNKHPDKKSEMEHTSGWAFKPSAACRASAEEILLKVAKAVEESAYEDVVNAQAKTDAENLVADPNLLMELKATLHMGDIEAFNATRDALLAKKMTQSTPEVSAAFAADPSLVTFYGEIFKSELYQAVYKDLKKNPLATSAPAQGQTYEAAPERSDLDLGV